jgi:hypothetical protein
VRAVIPGELRLESHDGPVAGDAQASVVGLIAVGGRGEEMLAPRLDPLDGTAEPARHRGHEYVFRVRVSLDAEASADLGGMTRTCSSAMPRTAAMPARTPKGTWVESQTVRSPVAPSYEASTPRPSMGMPATLG